MWGTPGMEAKLGAKGGGIIFTRSALWGSSGSSTGSTSRYNLRSMGCFISCGPKIRKLIREFQPDVVMGTGGYVSGMVLEKATLWGKDHLP